MSVIAFATEGFSATLSARIVLMLYSLSYQPSVILATVLVSKRSSNEIMARTGLLLIKKSGAKSQIKPVEHAQQHTMEQNNADIPVAAVVQNIVHADARPANACCTPQCGFCGLITLICLLVSGIPMLIAGAYYYSIYDQHSGIEYQREYI